MYHRPPSNNGDRKPSLPLENSSQAYDATSYQYPWDYTGIYSQYPYSYMDMSTSSPSPAAYDYYQHQMQQMMQPSYNAYYASYYTPAQPQSMVAYPYVYPQMPTAMQPQLVPMVASPAVSMINPQPTNSQSYTSRSSVSMVNPLELITFRPNVPVPSQSHAEMIRTSVNASSLVQSKLIMTNNSVIYVLYNGML
jgi:hypothetical protein